MGTLHENLYTFNSLVLRMYNVLDKSCKDNKNARFMYNSFSRKLFPLWYNVEKCGRARQTTDDNVAHALCTLDT